MSKHSHHKDKRTEKRIPTWAACFLLSIVSLLIAKSLHGVIVVLTASGIVMLFLLSYMSKPVADIQTKVEEGIFEKDNINRSTWRNPSEPNAQRRRYLKTLQEEKRRAA